MFLDNLCGISFVMNLQTFYLSSDMCLNFCSFPVVAGILYGMVIFYTFCGLLFRSFFVCASAVICLNVVNIPTNLQARYDLFCVKSAVKPQPTNQPCKCC